MNLLGWIFKKVPARLRSLGQAIDDLRDVLNACSLAPRMLARIENVERGLAEIGREPPSVGDRIEFMLDRQWCAGAVIEDNDPYWRVEAEPPINGVFSVWKANRDAWRRPTAARRVEEKS
jgi:hypothetical protein